MTTNTDVRPALTEEQWADLMTERGILVDGLHMRQGAECVAFSEGYEGVYITHEGMAAAIATLNTALPATDRRKLGWDYVDKLREIGARLFHPREEDPSRQLTDAADGLALLAIAAVIQSYLPPREKGADSA